MEHKGNRAAVDDLTTKSGDPCLGPIKLLPFRDRGVCSSSLAD